MNNKGYTLVELLIVISLIVVFSIISFISINDVIGRNKDDTCDFLINNIEGAAKEYISDKRYDSEFNFEKKKEIILNLNILFEENYLSGNLINPYTNESMDMNDFRIEAYLNDDYTVSDVLVLYNYGSEYREYVCDREIVLGNDEESDTLQDDVSENILK